ncbi:MAG: hypothetical protein F4Y86_02820 [Gammaproteobacteria bacterium]|nr:hypothetical protein [Gammaproteobacteria bacterium]
MDVGVGRKVVSDPLKALPHTYRDSESADALVHNGDWDFDGPAFEAVRDWVEVHWGAKRQTKPPGDTVISRDYLGPLTEDQLDAASASRKLIVATALHGVDSVAAHAVEFARHGMLEVHSMCLLTGPSISRPIRLDDHCSLLPAQDVLPRINTEFAFSLSQPLHHTSGLCALEWKRFDRPAPPETINEYAISPFLRHGLDTLTLILGLVWGEGLRPFARAGFTPRTVVDALPFPMFAFGGTGGMLDTFVSLRPSPSASKHRPLPVEEASALLARYGDLPEASARRIGLALRRLRDSAERAEREDRIIDACIALEALFMEEGENRNQRKTIAGRASWHFADSTDERERTRCTLKRFYSLHNDIVHGAATVSQAYQGEGGPDDGLVSDVIDVLRTSLKAMIDEGRPTEWDKSKQAGSFRHDPPRSESEIRSVKSDSLSWTVSERKEIDRALEHVWRQTLHETPAAPFGTNVVHCHAHAPEDLELFRRQCEHYVVKDPARLYRAHPMWPKLDDEEVDERTAYYCEQDVRRHMDLLGQAASAKGLSQFALPWEAYDPRGKMESWPRLPRR